MEDGVGKDGEVGTRRLGCWRRERQEMWLERDVGGKCDLWGEEEGLAGQWR